MIVAILGAGGHGKDCAEIARACGYEVEFFDDDPDKREWVTGPTVSPNLNPVALPSVAAANDPAVRRRLAIGSNPVTLVHPTATVAPTSLLMGGCVVGAGTQLGPDTILGQHVHVGPGCTITRTTVGAFTTIAPGVDIAGDVTIGEECLIGVGAVVSNLVTIGDRCVIGAGAVVVDDVPDDTTVAGVPARPLQRKEVSA